MKAGRQEPYELIVQRLGTPRELPDPGPKYGASPRKQKPRTIIVNTSGSFSGSGGLSAVGAAGSAAASPHAVSGANASPKHSSGPTQVLSPVETTAGVRSTAIGLQQSLWRDPTLVASTAIGQLSATGGLAVKTVSPFNADVSRPVTPGATGGRPATAKAAPAGGSTSVPKFPGYNPMVHLAASELPPPDTAASKRPQSANPITHVSERPSTAAAIRAATARGATGGGSRGGSRGATPRTPGSSGAAPRPTTPSIAAIRSGGALHGGMAEWLTIEERVKPGVEEEMMKSLRRDDLDADDEAQRYNSLLTMLIERARGRGRKSFKALWEHCDGGSGGLQAEEFKKLIRLLDHTAEDKYIELLYAEADADGHGSIDFNDFYSRLNAGKVRFRQYHPALRHRTHADSDHPLGGSRLALPYGSLSDLDEIATRNAALHERLATIFEAADRNGT